MMSAHPTITPCPLQPRYVGDGGRFLIDTDKLGALVISRQTHDIDQPERTHHVAAVRLSTICVPNAETSARYVDSTGEDTEREDFISLELDDNAHPTASLVRLYLSIDQAHQLADQLALALAVATAHRTKEHAA